MACDQIVSILKSCGPDSGNLGGIKSLYIAAKEDVSGTTITNGVITAITMSGSSKFQKFEFNKNSANYVEESPADLVAGSTIVNQTITLTLAKRDAAKRAALAIATEGQRDLYVIVLDYNGTYWLFGYENFMNITNIAGGSGTAKAEGSNYVVTLVGEERILAPTVTSGIIAAIVA